MSTSVYIVYASLFMNWSITRYFFTLTMKKQVDSSVKMSSRSTPTDFITHSISTSSYTVCALMIWIYKIILSFLCFFYFLFSFGYISFPLICTFHLSVSARFIRFYFELFAIDSILKIYTLSRPCLLLKIKRIYIPNFLATQKILNERANQRTKEV